MTETPQQAYISKVHLKGYKSIRDLEIDFKPGLNIIIGPNGSGKTNFLELISQFTWDAYKEREKVYIHALIKYIGNTNELIRETEGDFELRNDMPIFKETHRIYFNNQLIQHSETIYKSNNRFENKDLLNERIDKDGILEDNWWMSQMVCFGNPINDILKKGIDFKLGIYTDKYFLHPILSNTFLSEFEEYNIESFLDKIFYFVENDNSLIVNSKFIEYLREFTPIKNVGIQVERMSINKSSNEKEKTITNVLLNFTIENRIIGWHELSDGTRRMFYIIASFLGIGDTFLIEEPELGIHPDQLHKLMDFLIEQSKEKQIIITTHSPEVLNAIHPDELDRIIVTRYDAEKGTIMHKLTPEQAKEMGERVKEGDMFLSDRWVHLNLEDEIFNATKLNEK